MTKEDDITLSIQNLTDGTKTIDIWEELRKDETYIEKYKKYRKQIVIGSILFAGTDPNFIHCNRIKLDKYYDLKNYKKLDNNPYEALIYDFQKGYLSPMKYKPNLDEPCYITVLSNISILISLSLYNEY